MPLPDKDALLARVAPYRAKWRHAPRPDRIDTAGPGQQSVWDYPRPPAVQPVARRLKVIHAGLTIADTTRGLRIVETAGAPVYYIPPPDVCCDLLTPTDHVTVCEWKGAGVHYDLAAGGRSVAHAAFCYPDPLDDLGQGYARIAGWFAFYAGRVDACFVGDEQAAPQPGGYYAGWVTADLTGPIKGAAGSQGW